MHRALEYQKQFVSYRNLFSDNATFKNFHDQKLYTLAVFHSSQFTLSIVVCSRVNGKSLLFRDNWASYRFLSHRWIVRRWHWKGNVPLKTPNTRELATLGQGEWSQKTLSRAQIEAEEPDDDETNLNDDDDDYYYDDDDAKFSLIKQRLAELTESCVTSKTRSEGSIMPDYRYYCVCT
jgi:hypothetical protein